MEDHILIRYGELSLKKSNRKQFVLKITNCIKRALKQIENLEFESRGMRFYIMLNGNQSSNIIEILKKIPGIYSFSIVSRCKSNIEDIKDLTYKIVKAEDINKSFKVETNRAYKLFPSTSLEISKEVASNLFKNIEGLKADVHNPDYVLNIDVREEGTFVFTKTYYGIGGFPAGSMGKAMLMISGGIDSVVAGYMALKKGISLTAIHFFSPPYTSILAVQKVVDLLEKICPYTEYQNIDLLIVPFTKIQKAIYDNCREDYGITIMRRMMYRIAERIANDEKALAIVNGENVGQVASQTLESLGVIERVTEIPILRPLATLDKENIIKVSEQINTFDISVRPYEDCCTVFVPKHPQIKPKLSECIKQETKFDYEALLTEACNEIERHRLRSSKHLDLVSSDGFDDLL